MHIIGEMLFLMKRSLFLYIFVMYECNDRNLIMSIDGASTWSISFTVYSGKMKKMNNSSDVSTL